MEMYEYLVFKTAFARKAQTNEHLILTKESGHWEVSGTVLNRYLL